MNTTLILFTLYYFICLSIRWYAALRQRQLISSKKAIVYTEVEKRFGDYVIIYKVKNGYKDIEDTPLILFFQGFIWFYDITLLICSKLYNAFCVFVNGFHDSSIKQ